MITWTMFAYFYTAVVLIGALLSVSEIDRFWPYPMMPLICGIPLVLIPIIFGG